LFYEAEKIGVSENAVARRLQHGWSVEEILTPGGRVAIKRAQDKEREEQLMRAMVADAKSRGYDLKWNESDGYTVTSLQYGYILVKAGRDYIIGCALDAVTAAFGARS
jgi:hypothetical protein